MKKIIKIVLLIILPLTLLGQRKQTIIYWIPEKYIDSLVLNVPKNEYKNYLKPIEAIANENGRWLIGTYRGMFQPLIPSSKSNAQKIPIKELSLNLNVFTKEEQDSINQIKYFIKTYTDSLILEAYRGNNLLESKKYIKEFKGYKFEYLGKTDRVLLLQGRYDIYNSNGEKIESEIEIAPDGNVNGSQVLDSYDLKRVLIPDEHNNFYDLIEFHLKDKTIKKLAIIYNEKEKNWIGYDYQIKNDKYKIHILPKFIFRLQKI
ncbi:MAG: hypothetical protein IPL97_10520 [Niastella sp.]|nr:hypothetical protein [Niastella sp.]